MTTFKKQVFSALAAGALLLNTAVPVFASTDFVINGNAQNSTNNATMTVNSTTSIVQSNNANVTNNVSSDASTGGNDANSNNGGNVSVDTGNANVTTNVTNSLNSNAAQTNCCGNGNTTVNISGNAQDSQNTANLTQNNTVYVNQDNYAHVTNNVDADAHTGYNDANSNNGGSVRVTTGNAATNVSVSTAANANVASVGGNGNGNGSVSAMILGNAQGSDNSITLGLDRNTTVLQSNDAFITNNVDANAKTGGNDANYNNGGDVSVNTGNALADATVDNMVNFNAADVDCGCVTDVLAKIAGNAQDSENFIHGYLNDGNFVQQGSNELSFWEWLFGGAGNLAKLNNDVNANAKTGYNDANSNSGGVGNYDPSVGTGNATSHTDVSNTGNVNTVGTPIELPGGLSLQFMFQWSQFLSWFGSLNG